MFAGLNKYEALVYNQLNAILTPIGSKLQREVTHQLVRDFLNFQLPAMGCRIARPQGLKQLEESSTNDPAINSHPVNILIGITKWVRPEDRRSCQCKNNRRFIFGRGSDDRLYI